MSAATSATAATNQHYNLDPELFGSFLGSLRKYSSGLYRDPATAPDPDGDPADRLDAAQERKLRFVAHRLGLREGARLLDVGCGWGALVLYLALEYGCRTTGISPASRQHDYIREQAQARGVADRVSTVAGQFEQTDFAPASFDAVTMLGSIVHMPEPDEIFRRARAVLRPGGSLYVSESCFRNAAVRESFDARTGTEFVREAIFGNGELRPLSELIRAAENAGLSIIAVDDLTAHYRRTIEDWLRNVEAARAQIDARQPGMADDLVHYLQIANAGWGFTTKHYALTCRRSR